MIGIDPELVDPQNGDFRLQPDSPAQGYGCQTFPAGSRTQRGRSSPAEELAGTADEREWTESLGAGTESKRGWIESGQVRTESRYTPTEFVPGQIEQRRGAGARSSLDVSGPITTDTIWDVDSVRVQGDVEIARGVTLTIAAGVRVEFQNYYALTVRGCLRALGQPAARVHFTSRDPSAFGIDSTLTGAWAGIRFPFTSEINAPSRLEYCLIEYAKNAGNGERGGALRINAFSKLRVVNTVLRHNVADFGAAMACTHFASPEILGCLVVENVAFWGGAAVHCLDAFPRLISCTIVDNEDRNLNIFDPAAAIYAHISKPSVTGCILRDNTSWYFEPTQILYGKSFYTTFSDIGDHWPGKGNFDSDPLFLETGEHPYGLQEDSPCVDAGVPDTTGLGLPRDDIAGTARIVSGRVDVGAYEGDPGNAGVDGIDGTDGADGTDGTDAIDGTADLRAALRTAYPNPFGTSTTIRLSLASAQHVRVAVYDATGREVNVLADGYMPAGSHEIAWAGRDRCGRALPSGVYLVRMRTATSSGTAKVVLPGVK